MRASKNVVLALMALLLMVGIEESAAQHTYKFRDSLGTYTVKFTPNEATTTIAASPTRPINIGMHELRLSTSFGASDAWGNAAFNNEINYYGSSDLNSHQWYGGPSHRYTIVFDYGYYATEWLSVGASAAWMIGHRNIFESYTHRHLRTLREDNIAIMPIARFAWFRRNIVQLYSSVGLGLGIDRWQRDYYGIENMVDFYFACDFKFLGITIGRKWFGFAEVGVGSRGIINVGFGCRIN